MLFNTHILKYNKKKPLDFSRGFMANKTIVEGS